VRRSRAACTRAHLLEAGDGAAALALLDDAHPDLLAVLDMNMPGMSGLNWPSGSAPAIPDMKLALLTANVQEAIQRRAAALGVRFFRKPIGEAVIADILGLLE
jgi:CheY-like chemotaxis protein